VQPLGVEADDERSLELTESENEGARRVYAPSEWIVEIPFDSSEWMRRGEPTYGGEPMEDWLPLREEWPVIWRVQAGLSVAPAHDSHVAPNSVVSS